VADDPLGASQERVLYWERGASIFGEIEIRQVFSGQSFETTEALILGFGDLVPKLTNLETYARESRAMLIATISFDGFGRCRGSDG